MDSSPQPPVAAPATDDVAVMARNGITRTEAFYYHVDGFRYSSLRDALAQVARGSALRERGA